MKRALVSFIAACLYFITLTAQDEASYVKLAEELMSEGETMEALGHYVSAIELIGDKEGHARTFAFAAICAKDLGQYDVAKDYFTQSINRGIEEPMVYDMLGDIAKSEKDYTTQIFAYMAGVNRIPSEKQNYQLKICSVYKKMKSYQDMLDMSSAVLNDSPENTKALEYKGTALKGLKRMSESYAVFSELYDVDSTNVNANIFLGNYNYQVGKSKLNSARKKYDALSNPSRLQWDEHNKKTTAIIEKYYVPAIPYLEFVYNKNSNKNIKTMLHAIYTKTGDSTKAELYK